MPLTMTLYKDRFRVESARLPGWAYTAPGVYFITICMRDRRWSLGRVAAGVVRLSPAGRIVDDEWHRTAVVRAKVSLDAWVVMPNHVHGIVIIRAGGATPNDARGDGGAADDRGVPGHRAVPNVETPRRGVSTNADARTSPSAPAPYPDAPAGAPASNANASNNTAPAPSPSRLHPGSLGAIIGQYKSVCTKRIRAAEIVEFAWQARFYDRILRDRHALRNVRRYIAMNPARWERDRNNLPGLWI